MKVMILGMGHVGKALGKKLRDEGHQIVGTTIFENEVPELETIAEKVFVLYGHEAEKVKAAAEGCDVVVMTAAPNAKDTRTIEERHKVYKEVLQDTCASVRATGIKALFCSSFSVFGDGGAGTDPVTEETPTANQQEPSALYFNKGEQEILATDKGCVLRFPDMYGAPGDLSFTEKVNMAREYFAGKCIFDPDAPYYAIHYLDVMAALCHAIDNDLVGVFNVCDNDQVPPTNKTVFDAICAQQGWDPLEYTSAIKAPTRKISAQKIYDTGYRIAQGDPHADLLIEV